MGGITGLVLKDTPQPGDLQSDLERMAKAIAHRGNRDETKFVNDKVGLSARDFTQGSYTTEIFETDELVIILDGNIANKSELIHSENISNIHTSAELVASLYQVHKSKAFQKLDGSFAIVIYNKLNGKITLARDMFSGRPLFFAHQKGNFWFGSEIKAILASETFKRNVNRKLIPQSLKYGLTFGPETLFKDVTKVIPGYYFEGDAINGFSARYIFNDVDYRKDNKSVQEYSDTIWDLIGKNIRNQSGAARRVGLFLSGGVDSSLVAKKQAELDFESALAISCGYSDDGAQDKDETAIALATAKQSGMDFENICVSSSDDLIGVIRNIVYKMDEPTRFAISIPIETSIQALEGRFDCLLTGMFADVLFGTEEHYDSPLYWANKKLPGFMRFFLRQMFALFKVSGIRKLVGWSKMYARFSVPSMKHYMLVQERHNPDLKGLVEDVEIEDCAPEIQKIYDQIKFRYPDDEWTRIASALYVYCWNELFEILASYGGIDTLHPFISKEMFELSLTMPYKYKIASEHTKPCLRELAARKLSAELAYMKKIQFQSPGSIWLAKSEQLKSYLLGLQEPTARIKEFMDAKAVDNCIEQFKHELMSGKISEKLSRILYSLIGYELWLEQFFTENEERRFN